MRWKPLRKWQKPGWGKRRRETGGSDPLWSLSLLTKIFYCSHWGAQEICNAYREQGATTKEETGFNKKPCTRQVQCAVFYTELWFRDLKLLGCKLQAVKLQWLILDLMVYQVFKPALLRTILGGLANKAVIKHIIIQICYQLANRSNFQYDHF